MSQSEIHTPRDGHLIGRSMTATSPVLSPSSILTPPSSQSTFISVRKKFGARLIKKLFPSFTFLELRNSEIA
jgi:hypothetical protein